MAMDKERPFLGSLLRAFGPAQPPGATADPPPASPRGKKAKILLVDDEHLVRSLTDALVFEGFDVQTAMSGEEALTRLESFPPDVIILDLNMPGMGGLAFLRRISTPEGKTLHPVLVLTARAAMKDFFDSVAVEGFLAKPCSTDELLARVRSVVARHRAREDPLLGESRGPTILLAEDEPEIARRIEHRLTASGYSVVLAANGPEALEKTTECHPRLILLKEVLPGMNGSALVPLLRAMPGSHGIPIVLYDDTRLDEAAMSARPHRPPAGVTKYVKSVDTATLLGAVESILRPPDAGLPAAGSVAGA
jgi:CheY-like chemotaxis protein